MALWGFNRESTQPAIGANTVAGIKKGYQAPFVSGGEAEVAEKRNVIATSAGWVRRQHKTDSHGNARVIDQVIVAAHPGSGLDYTSNTYLGNPDIVQMYVKLNANGYMSANATNANLYVVFNCPISWKASGNLCSITVANTISGNAAVARFANSQAQGRITNANNTLIFRLPMLQANVSNGAATTATYKIAAQTISVTGNPLINPDDGTNPGSFANLVITGAVSNSLYNGAGTKITTFQVRAGG